jgi:hypothetical protein
MLGAEGSELVTQRETSWRQPRKIFRDLTCGIWEVRENAIHSHRAHPLNFFGIIDCPHVHLQAAPMRILNVPFADELVAWADSHGLQLLGKRGVMKRDGIVKCRNVDGRHQAMELHQIMVIKR